MEGRQGSGEPAELVVVRHGATAWSDAGRHTGRTDLPLTPRGVEAARRLEQALAGWSFGLVLSSPRRRALETCRLAGLGGCVEVCGLLVEWDYGDYEGLTTREILERRPGWSLWRDGCPGGEDAQAVGRRADELLARLADGGRVSGQPAVLFSHGHFLRVLAARWLGLDPSAGGLFSLDPSSLSVLGHEHGTRTIARWNA
jgi:broad specificity phosphatase PhoE